MKVRLVAVVAAALAVSPAASAQESELPEGNQRLFQLRAHDLPGLFAAIGQGRTGKLLADPDVAAALRKGIDAYLKDIEPWLTDTDFLLRNSPGSAPADLRFERALHRIDWHDLQDLDLSAVVHEAASPDQAHAEFREPMLAFGLRPNAAGSARVGALFDEIVQTMRDAPPPGLVLAASQEVLGRPGLRLEQSQTPVQGGPMMYGVPDALWARRADDLLTCGSGTSACPLQLRGEEPHVALGVNAIGYFRMMSGFLFGSPNLDDLLVAIGIDNATWFEWRLATNGDLLQDDLALRFDGEPHGILGALLKSTAPLPPQPLPEGALLQLRCGFEMAPLLQSVDRLLAFSEQRTLAEQGLHADLERAWTGGLAFAIARPTGGLVPRMYLSFGIADEAALGRLLERLAAAPFVKVTPRKVGEREAQVVALEGLPPALTPCYCLVNGTLHVAESMASLKAQLAAIDAGARPAMDVGKAAKPRGAGTTMPGMELRFDAAALQMTLQATWMPLLAAANGGGKPYVALQDLPEADLLAEHLVAGRAVLRRDGTTYSLCSTGTLGSPFLQGLATILGPYLTSQFASQREYQRMSVQSTIATYQLNTLHKAIVDFERKEQRKPTSLGELLAKGLVRDVDVALPGDPAPEALLHDGKEVGRASYRYYPKPLKVSPDGEEIDAELIAIPKVAWWRMAIDAAGTLHTGYGEFSETSLDDIEKKAKGKGE